MRLGDFRDKQGWVPRPNVTVLNPQTAHVLNPRLTSVFISCQPEIFLSAEVHSKPAAPYVHA